MSLTEFVHVSYMHTCGAFFDDLIMTFRRIPRHDIKREEILRVTCFAYKEKTRKPKQ